MSRYLDAFDHGSMDHIAAAALHAVSEATRAVWRGAPRRRGCGSSPAACSGRRPASLAPAGTVLAVRFPQAKAVIGGLCILEVASHAEVRAWASRLMQSCGFAQEVRAVMFDPES